MSETKAENKGEAKGETKAEGKEHKAKKGAADGGAPKIADHNELPQHAARAEKKKSRWTVATCQKVAKRFHSRAEWASHAPSSYKAASARGWVEQCCKQMQEPAKKAVAPRSKKSA